MKPLLILPPAPLRWPALAELLDDAPSETWRDELQRRCVDSVPNCADAFATILDGGRCDSFAWISKRGPLGVVGQVTTRTDARRRGLARAVLSAAVAWFDLTGGKHLYAFGPEEVAAPLFGKLGFAPLHTHAGRASLVRVAANCPPNPYDEPLDGPLKIRPTAPGDWCPLVVLMQHHASDNPAQSSAESAVNAPRAALDLLHAAETHKAGALAAWRQRRLLAVGSVALDQPGERTIAALLPHDAAPEELRTALPPLARRHGYSHVDFALEQQSSGTGPAAD